MDLKLKDKIVMVTGATGGIGMAICMAFLLEGSIVLAGYRGDEKRLNELKALAKESGVEEQLSLVLLNMSDTEYLEQAVKDCIKEHKKIDVLINCAAMSVEKPFLLMTTKEMSDQIQTNLMSVMHISQIVAKNMLMEHSGNIVNISSILSRRWGRGATVYAASKAALERFTEALACEVGRKGIRINAVCPGIIQTKMSVNIQKNLPLEILKHSAMARHGEPEEVAPAVLFLASDHCAGYITGHTLVVDGGFSI